MQTSKQYRNENERLKCKISGTFTLEELQKRQDAEYAPRLEVVKETKKN